MDHPSEGMPSEDIRRMSEDDLLDMDYFLSSIFYTLNGCVSNVYSINTRSFYSF